MATGRLLFRGIARVLSFRRIKANRQHHVNSQLQISDPKPVIQQWQERPCSFQSITVAEIVVHSSKRRVQRSILLSEV